MFPALLLASMMLLQDPKPAPKTVEERLKELDEKIAALERKREALGQENAAMEKTIADAKAWKESYARQSATAWLKQYAAAARLTEKQSAELEELWYGWNKGDLEKGGDPARWTGREQEIRSRLSPEQATLLARKVREEREQNARATVAGIARSVKLPSEKSDSLVKAVMVRLKIEEGPLLTQAHPQELANAWGQTLLALDGGLSDISSSLTEQELQSLRKFLDQWKPKQR